MDADAPAANGKDKGAFTIHFDKLPAAVDKMMKVVGAIKANERQGRRRGAREEVRRRADRPAEAHHRAVLRYPKASFVYSVKM